ncbi:hypothetical protein C7B82_12785 [Stenomitos frigidus ULC18]|uniref:Uncharacterized protein n=1 Tax=Stenomitos frigidus ULC18 TaxID=2107698 RepID=A0A2T1E7J9_9CYAN|nr:hypothetical protein C7B82_12785 [Stenomitos frigidus ULC18]
MGNTTLSFGDRDLTVQSKEIERPSANQSPVFGSMSELEGTIIFTKDDIFDPMETVFNTPMPSNPHGKLSCAWLPNS